MARIKLLMVAACMWALLPAPALSPQEPPVAPSPPGMLQPFSTGEKLIFQAKWDPPWYMFFLPSMEAGEGELQLVGETLYKDRKALKVTFKARSSGRLMRMVGMKIEDEFLFLSDPETYCSLYVHQKIREGKRKRQIEVEYLQATRQLHIRTHDESVTPPRLQKDEIKDKVPACVYDPFTALYLYRKSDLRPQHVRTMMIGNDDKFKEVQAQVENKEVLNTVLGKLPAWNVTTTALKGDLFRSGGQFRIWFSADERKLPLQFEAKVNVGRVFGRLISVEN
jgi:hypothetical protein